MAKTATKREFTVPADHTQLAAALVRDEQCERMVLSVLLQFDGAFYQCADIINDQSFYEPANQALYTAISGVVAEGNKPTIISVNAYTAQHDDIKIPDGYIFEVAADAMTSTDFMQNCARLRDLEIRRQLYSVGCAAMNMGTTEEGDAMEMVADAVEQLKSVTDLKSSSIKTFHDALADVQQITTDNLSGHRHSGVPTGFSFLDNIGGLMPSDLVVIAAESSQGKTSLALDFATSAAMSGHPVAFYSAEMTATQLAARAVAAAAGISSRAILMEPMTNTQLADYDRAVTRLDGMPLYIDEESTISINRIISSIRRLERKHHIKVAFIDYLQILQNNGRKRDQTEEQFFGETARRLKNLAKELNICIVLLSQLSRSRDTTEPTLSRVRGSGQVVEAADVVVTIYRPSVYGKSYGADYINIDPTGTALLEIKKGRNIGLHSQIVGFSSTTTHFYELATIPVLPPSQRPALAPKKDDNPF